MSKTRTGIDVCIRECRAMGYPVVEHDNKTKRCNVNKMFRLTISNPQCWPDGFLVPHENKELHYQYDGMISYRDMYKFYKSRGSAIADYCDEKNCPIPDLTNEFVEFTDFVNLANILHGYCGLPY